MAIVQGDVVELLDDFSALVVENIWGEKRNQKNWSKI